MNLKLFGLCVLATLCSIPVYAGPKPPVPCKAYVIVVEHDEVTVGLSMVGMNKPQRSWFRKHGDKGKYAGVCTWNTPGDMQESVAALPSKPPRDIKPGLPVYTIIWGEHLVSQPYSYSYTTQEEAGGTVSGTVTDNNGDTADVQGTTTTTVPVEHRASGVKRYYVADGWLAVWKPSANHGKGAFVPVGPLHNHNHWVFTSASTSLLKDGLGKIAKRERAKK